MIIVIADVIAGLGIADMIAGQVYSGPELHESNCQDFGALVAGSEFEFKMMNSVSKMTIIISTHSYECSRRELQRPRNAVRFPNDLIPEPFPTVSRLWFG